MVDLGLGRGKVTLILLQTKLQWACRIVTTYSLYTLSFFVLWAMRKCLLDTIYYFRQEDLWKSYFCHFGSSAYCNIYFIILVVNIQVI